jgi:hydrogenase nickel incorporation protein HypA/HybF
MHELGITRNVIEVATAALAERHVTRNPTALQLEVGRFTSVVPDAVRFYFEILARGTPFEGADLQIVTVPLRTHCRTCGADAEPAEPTLLCPVCDGLTEIVSGRELRLVSIDVPEEAA